MLWEIINKLFNLYQICTYIDVYASNSNFIVLWFLYDSTQSWYDTLYVNITFLDLASVIRIRQVFLRHYTCIYVHMY